MYCLKRFFFFINSRVEKTSSQRSRLVGDPRLFEDALTSDRCRMWITGDFRAGVSRGVVHEARKRCFPNGFRPKSPCRQKTVCLKNVAKNTNTSTTVRNTLHSSSGSRSRWSSVTGTLYECDFVVRRTRERIKHAYKHAYAYKRQKYNTSI